MVTALLGYVTPLALIVPLILMGWGNGLNMPNAMANALASVPANRVGAASALMGFVQMIAAAVLTLLIGYVPHPRRWNIGIGVAVTGIVGLVGSVGRSCAGYPGATRPRESDIGEFDQASRRGVLKGCDTQCILWRD